jgi:hypothetical protein
VEKPQLGIPDRKSVPHHDFPIGTDSSAACAGLTSAIDEIAMIEK